MKNRKLKNHTHKSTIKDPPEGLDSFFHQEATLINTGIEKIKKDMNQGSGSSEKTTSLAADAKKVDEYFDSATELFKQISIECGDDLPFEARVYETFILPGKGKIRPSGKKPL